MTETSYTLGRFIAHLMQKQGHTNVSLAAAAGVSEGVIRNLLKHGDDPRAKDPDPRTLRQVADALGISALYLFRMANYLPPQPDANSVRAEYLADVFDELSPEKQDAVMGVIEALSEKPSRKRAIQTMRKASAGPLEGFDLALPDQAREMANQLIVQLRITHPSQLLNIDNNIQLVMNRWGDLPQSTQERIKALVRHKLALKYDPTMVDEQWREM